MQVTEPASVNFTALEKKLITTWMSLSVSPMMVGTSLSVCFISLMSFWSKREVVAAAALSITSARETFSWCFARRDITSHAQKIKTVIEKSLLRKTIARDRKLGDG